MSADAGSPGPVRAFFHFYLSPRRSVRSVLDRRPSEAALTAMIMLACVIVLLGRLVQVHLQYANPDDRLELSMQHTVTQLIFLPLFYFGFAAIVRMIARLFGGEAGWRESRIAVFWAALVSSPIMVAALLFPVLLLNMPMLVRVVVGQLGGAFLAWALAQCIAEAFGFRRTWLVFATICAPILILFLIAFLTRM